MVWHILMIVILAAATLVCVVFPRRSRRGGKKYIYLAPAIISGTTLIYMILTLFFPVSFGWAVLFFWLPMTGGIAWILAKKRGNGVGIAAATSLVAIVLAMWPGQVLSSPPSGSRVALELSNGEVRKVAVQSSMVVSGLKSRCDTVKYFAYDAPAGSHNFGPTLRVASAEEGAQHFANKMCDPLWLATTVHSIKFGAHIDRDAVMTEAKSYVDDPAKYEAAKQFVSGQIVSFALAEADGVRYASLGMTLGGNPTVMPTLTKMVTNPNLGQALVAKTKDGKEVVYRVECNLQPAAKDYSSVPAPATPEVTPPAPPKSTPPPSSTTPPPSTPSTSTTTPPPSTTTTTSTPPSTTTTTTTPPETTTTTTTPPETTTTTTPPETTTTTTNPKGSVPYPTGKPPVSSPPGDPEVSAPVESNPAQPTNKPGDEVPNVPAPGATQDPTRGPIPTPVDPEGPSSEAPGTGIEDPDASSGAQAAMSLVLMSLLGGGYVFKNRREKTKA